MPASRAIASSTTSAGCSALKEEIEDAEVELSTVLGRGKITMQQLMDMQAGDILPCDFTGRATVLAEDVPDLPRHVRRFARPAGRADRRARRPQQDRSSRHSER